MDRFASAAESLLRERTFASITVQDIVRRAGRPIGSFYARFPSKEALMPHLYQRYNDGLEPLIAARVAAVAWDKLSFPATCAGIVDLFLSIYAERRWLLRELILFARQHPEALPDGLVEQRQATFGRAVQVLLRHRDRFTHDDPEYAARFALYMLSAVARDKLLFPEAPHSRATPMTEQGLRDELVRSLTSYLGGTV